MALRRCRKCTTRFAVGLPACPHCQSTDHEEDGAMSPKITRHGGPTIAGASVVGGAWSDADEPDIWPEESSTELRGEHGPDVLDLPHGSTVQRTSNEGGEESSPGSSSSASDEKPQTTPAPSEPAPRKRARTTGNRSAKGRTASSSAGSTDGVPTGPTSGPADES